MIPSADLHELIHALDKKEKIFFRQYSSGEGDQKYLQLFDAIAAQKVYDEAAIRKKFRNASFIRRLPAMKNYLSNVILSSLFVQYSAKTETAAIDRGLRIVEIMLQKGLRRRGEKMLKRIKAEAISGHHYLVALQTIGLQRNLARSGDPHLYYAEEKKLREEEDRLLQLYLNLNAYRDLDNRLFQLRRVLVVPRSRADLKPYRQLLSESLLRSESSALTSEARYLFHRIKGGCYFTLSSPQRSLVHRQKLVELCESEGITSNELLLRFSSVLYEKAVTLRELGRSEEALKTVNMIYDLPKIYSVKISERSEAVLFKRAAMLETDIYQHAGLFDEGAARIGFVERGLKLHRLRIEKDIELILRYNVAMLYYGAGQLRKALRWISDIINEHEQDFVTDLLSFAHIFRFIILADMRDDDLLTSIARSATNYIQRRKRIFRTETLFLELMKEVVRFRTENYMQDIYRKMKKRFEQLYTDPHERRAAEFFNFIAWFESRITGKSFAEVYRHQFSKTIKKK